MSSSAAFAPTVTTRDAGEVVIGTQTFTVTELMFSAYTDAITREVRPAKSDWHLTGARGATYFLRGFLNQITGADDGVRQVISWKSGQPLRVRGNEVRVVVVGTMIEQYVPTARG